MFKVGFDDQIHQLRAQGGIRRYFNNLSTGLSNDKSIETCSFIARRSLLAWASKYKSEADIIHATFYKGKPYILDSETRLISTLHDMTPERYPEQFKLGQWRSVHANKHSWLTKSDLILSVSQASADDLYFFWPMIKTPVKVIHLMTEMGAQQTREVSSLLGRKFWLYIGKSHDYKNGMILLKALSIVSEIASKHKATLVFVGGEVWSRREKKIITQHNLHKQVLKLQPDDAQLAWLYRHCQATLVPSLAEGFSLPLIEALSCNSPIAASDIEVHREVAGSFAEIVSPLNTYAWVEYLEASLLNHALTPKEKLGNERLQERICYYSKTRFLEDHITAYDESLNLQKTDRQ